MAKIPDTDEGRAGPLDTDATTPPLTRRQARQARQAEKKKRNPWVEWGVLIGGALIIAIVIRAFVFQTFWIPSESMVPTLKIDDRVLVNKLSYKLHDPNRGDVLVFKAPPMAKTAEIKDLIKRVVGLPGETIEGKGGHIYINGKLLKEDYLPKGVESRTFGPVKVPKDSYFLLGDNRSVSEDSTYFGAVNRDQLIGRAFLRIWPLNRLGFL
jgi:signal peptidase I